MRMKKRKEIYLSETWKTPTMTCKRKSERERW